MATDSAVPRAWGVPTWRAPAWSLAVVAMLAVQLGGALSVGLFPALGPVGTAWLRLVAGSVILLVIVRPRRRDVPRDALLAILGLGVATAVMTVVFMVAIDRIPLGAAVAIEFLGPLTVAALRANDRRMLLWPALAMAGVLLLTRPWQGEVDAVGVLAAALGAVGWGTYILLTQQVGERVSGVKALALTLPIAAVVTLPFGVGPVMEGFTWPILGAVFALAALMPVLPFALEMLALRRLTATAFGTLMALEPGFAVVIGAVVLHQLPALLQLVGVVLVIVAGMGAERRGRKPSPQE